MYDLHISICLTIDAWYRAFAVGGLSNCQKVGRFKHASKHERHSNILTISGSSLLVCACNAVFKITHPSMYWANTTKKTPDQDVLLPKSWSN
jgi:hypothetical protein